MSTALVTGAATASVATAYGGGAPSAASLQAQLQRYQRQLSDCVNCASAKTPQGKADIQAISARIAQVEQRIAQAQDGRASPQQTAPQNPASSPAGATRNGSIDVYA